MRRRIARRALFVAAVAAAGASGPAAAQQSLPCEVETRAGLRLVASAPPVADGSPIGEAARGTTLAFGTGCVLSPRHDLRFEIEAAFGPALTFVSVWAKPGLVAWSTAGSDARLTVAGAFGWTTVARGTRDRRIRFEPVPGDRALVAGTSGPALGAGMRGDARILGPLRLVLDAAWRVSFLDETIFVAGPEESEGRTVQLVALTAGLLLTI